MSSPEYSTPITLTETITVIKAIAKSASDYFPTAVSTYEIPVCARPIITVNNNVATITGYSGMTPMINSSVVNNTLGLDDKRNYPVYRSYSLGLNIQF
jgi:hypothetical protein